MPSSTHIPALLALQPHLGRLGQAAENGGCSNAVSAQQGPGLGPVTRPEASTGKLKCPAACTYQACSLTSAGLARRWKMVAAAMLSAPSRGLAWDLVADRARLKRLRASRQAHRARARCMEACAMAPMAACEGWNPRAACRHTSGGCTSDSMVARAYGGMHCEPSAAGQSSLDSRVCNSCRCSLGMLQAGMFLAQEHVLGADSGELRCAYNGKGQCSSERAACELDRFFSPGEWRPM